MRCNVNLATEPYQDAGRFYRRWSLALLVMTVVSVVLVYGATNAVRDSRSAKAQQREARQRLAQLESWEKADREILDEPENRTVRDRSELLNDLIRRKSFSWTQVFSDLERIMPGGLHVVSIKPEMSPDNQLAIRMTVAGASRERRLELLRKLEQSKTFRSPAVEAESSTSARPPDTFQFDISALYTPQAAAPSAAPVQARADAPAREVR